MGSRWLDLSTPIEQAASDPVADQWVYIAMQIRASGGTYCYAHKLTPGCWRCSPWGFPDLTPFLDEAIAREHRMLAEGVA